MNCAAMPFVTEMFDNLGGMFDVAMNYWTAFDIYLLFIING